MSHKHPRAPRPPILVELDGPDNGARPVAPPWALSGPSRAVRETLAWLARVLASASRPGLVSPPGSRPFDWIRVALRLARPRSLPETLPRILHGSRLNERPELLSGWARGAFTGASEDQAGLLECHAGETIILTEPEELDRHAAARLAEILDRGSSRRLGECRRRPAKGRLITVLSRRATDSESEVHPALPKRLQGRVATQAVRIPTLHERSADLPALIRGHSARSPRLTPGALERLLRHPWPGDLEELSSLLVRLELQRDLDESHSTEALVDEARLEPLLGDTSSPVLEPDSIGATSSTDFNGFNNFGSTETHESLTALLERQQRERQTLARRTVERCGGSRSLAARLLGISRRRLRRLLDDAPARSR